MNELLCFNGPYIKEDYEESEAFELSTSLDICQEMDYVKEVVSAGLKNRPLKLRQPLAKATAIVRNPLAICLWVNIFLEEWNIKFLHIIDIRCLTDDRSEKDRVIFDSVLTQELKDEGWIAEFKRTIQNFRKKAKLQIEDKPLANFVCNSDIIMRYLDDVCKNLNVIYDPTIDATLTITVNELTVNFGLKLGNNYVCERKP